MCASGRNKVFSTTSNMLQAIKLKNDDSSFLKDSTEIILFLNKCIFYLLTHDASCNILVILRARKCRFIEEELFLLSTAIYVKILIVNLHVYMPQLFIIHQNVNLSMHTTQLGMQNMCLVVWGKARSVFMTTEVVVNHMVQDNQCEVISHLHGGIDSCNIVWRRAELGRWV